MRKLNKILAPFSLIASSALSYLYEGDRPIKQTNVVQSPEAKEWYLQRAEEKRKRKAEKLKRDYKKR